MDGAGKRGRVAQRERGKPGKVGSTMQDAVELPQLSLQTLGQGGVVVRAGTFQIQRIQQRLRAQRGGTVIDAIELGHLAPKHHHRRTGGSAGAGRRGPQATGSAGNQNHPTGQVGPCDSLGLRTHA